MIRIAIIEDEIPAREKLKRFMKELQTNAEVVAELSRIDTAVECLRTTEVDLIISDIELQDGNAFEIFSRVALPCPIIFTTAYDQFWMKAFETNGIDYLMKPFSKDRFQKAWDKYLLLRKSEKDKNILLDNLTMLLEQSVAEKKYKKRFAVHTHQGILFLDTDNIVFFEANEGVIFAFDIFGKKHVLRYSTLKEIESRINPADFFRINRSELVSRRHIEKIERYSRNTLAIKMKGSAKLHVASQSNTSTFREWIDE